MLDKEEMLKTFNCGIGMVLIINKDDIDIFTKIFSKTKYKPKIIGYIGNRNNNKNIVMSRPKVIIFISGNGSNLQNIINNIDSDFLKMDIVAVVSNNSDAKGLARAEEAGIGTIVIDTSNKYIDQLLTLDKYL